MGSTASTYSMGHLAAWPPLLLAHYWPMKNAMGDGGFGCAAAAAVMATLLLDLPASANCWSCTPLRPSSTHTSGQATCGQPLRGDEGVGLEWGTEKERGRFLFFLHPSRSASAS